MKQSTTSAAVFPAAIVEEAWQDVGASFERFCLTAGIATLAGMMEEDAARLCGPRYERADGRGVYRWGKTKGKVGFHGGKIEIKRPRVRGREGGELSLPSWQAALSDDLLGQWALNLMLINVSTRKLGRAVRLPGGDVPSPKGAGVSKSAVSRRFVALSAERMKGWMAAEVSKGSHPSKHLPVPLAGRRKGSASENAILRIDHCGDMQVLVGIDTADDATLCGLLLNVHVSSPGSSVGFAKTECLDRTVTRQKVRPFLSHRHRRGKTSPQGAFPGGRQVRGKTRLTVDRSVGQAAPGRLAVPAYQTVHRCESQAAREQPARTFLLSE